jgi:hypothetical protein
MVCNLTMMDVILCSFELNKMEHKFRQNSRCSVSPVLVSSVRQFKHSSVSSVSSVQGSARKGQDQIKHWPSPIVKCILIEMLVCKRKLDKLCG